MDHSFIFWIIIGAVAGWLAGVLLKGGGFGLLMDILLGVVGAFVGGWLAGLLGVSMGVGVVGSLVTATIGAVIVLFVARLVKQAF